MTNKVLITSALPYANGPLHFGHIAGAYLPGDCYARFERLRGADVLYVCGSDEHGVAITLSAEKARRSPKEHVDLFHGINKAFFERLDFSFDHYSRTTWEGHKEPVIQYFKDLLDNGYIEDRVTEQLYSEEDKRFMADRYVTGTCPNCSYERARGDECPKCGFAYEATDLKNPRSAVTNATLTRKETRHWFLLLDKFKDRLIAHIDSKGWRPNVTNFVREYVKGLRPRAITRDSSWGIPVPLDGADGKVLYVWFDAPIGYISASIEWAQLRGEPERWKDYWCDEKTKLVNFIGKDNIPFHAVIFPAMTMGQNQPFKVVDELPANEFLNLEGRQFSKSEGWYIDLDDFFSKYSTDQIRYALAANAPETSDAEFTWKGFQGYCNTDLLGKYGNLVNRTLVFAKSRCEGKVPPRGELTDTDREFLQRVDELAEQAALNYEGFSIRKASQTLMELAQLGNTYFDHQQPWKSAKDPATVPDMQRCIASCLHCLKTMALISSPLIPSTAQAVWELLGCEGKLEEMKWSEVSGQELPEGRALPEPKILFRKVEDAEIEAETAKLQAMAKEAEASQTVEYTPLKEAIHIDNFRQLDLRVGQVLAAEKVPKSKRLLKLQVDLGFDQRQIVAGVAQTYKAEQLPGKKVIVVANLAPASIMGVESQGMLLAGNWSKNLELVNIDSLPPGAVVS